MLLNILFSQYVSTTLSQKNSSSFNAFIRFSDPNSLWIASNAYVPVISFALHPLYLAAKCNLYIAVPSSKLPVHYVVIGRLFPRLK